MVKCRLVIEVREDDKVYVTGPLEKKDYCLAMLEEAKEAVMKWKKTSIVVPGIKDLKLK